MCVLIVFSIPQITAKAAEEDGSSNVIEYVIDVSEAYAEVCETQGSIYVSQEILVYEYETWKIIDSTYLLFSEEEIYGQIIVGKSMVDECSYTSSYVKFDIPIKINNVEKTKLCIVVANNSTQLYISDSNNTTSYALKGEENVVDDTQVLLDKYVLLQAEHEYIKNSQSSGETKLVNEGISSYSVRTITQQPIVYDGTGASAVLSVKRVSNVTIDGEGICWAAASASMINYIKGTNYSAKNVYDYLDKKYWWTPKGNETWVTRAFKDLAGININCIYQGLTSTIVRNHVVVNKKPIYASLNMYKLDDNGNYYKYGTHAVVIAGYKVVSSGKLMYYIIDSNSSSSYDGYWVVVSSKAKTNPSFLDFVTDYGNQTRLASWFRSYYY